MPLKSALKTVLNTLLPPRCPGSGEIVDAPGMISPGFWKELSFISAPHCETCGLPFGFDIAQGALCAACLETEPAFDKARAAVTYNDASRQLVLGFKYGDRLHAVTAFTPWLLRAGGDLVAQSDAILPVPLHRTRLWQRRFNQSALLARALAKRAGKPCLPDTLRRVKATVPQKGLSRKERAENVKNAFGVEGDLRGKTLLLVDDVYTSGATLNACAKALKKAGAEKVFVLTIARVTREEF